MQVIFSCLFVNILCCLSILLHVVGDIRFCYILIENCITFFSIMLMCSNACYMISACSLLEHHPLHWVKHLFVYGLIYFDIP
jgi:hypothetical protein